MFFFRNINKIIFSFEKVLKLPSPTGCGKNFLTKISQINSDKERLIKNINRFNRLEKPFPLIFFIFRKLNK